MSIPIVDMSKSKNIDLVNKETSMGKNLGLGNKVKVEPVPEPARAESERWSDGQNNSFVVLGRDRPAGRYSGFGGRGATACGRIDLIAGLGSSFKHPDGSYGPPNDETEVSPNFAMDAARIYISQKSSIDKYMGLARVPGQRSHGRSAIGLKADEIRIHSRRDIKLVTGRGHFAGLGKDGERLSNGKLNEVPGTISFIAGNNVKFENLLNVEMLKRKRTRGQNRKLQPISKGDNLVDCLNEIISSIRRISSIVGGLSSVVSRMDLNLVAHTHPLAPPVATSPNTYTPLSAFVQAQTTSIAEERKMIGKNLDTIVDGYLNENKSGKFINSEFVFTT